MNPSQELLSRKEAAERLNISVRTLDRYIRRGHFDVQRIDRHVWISKPSFESYYQGRLTPEQEATEAVSKAISEAGATFTGKARPKLSQHEHNYSHQLSPAHIYQGLYQELQGKYEERGKRLEGAHYRVGQLEAQLKSMVPPLEVKKERQRLLLMDKKYKTEMKEARVAVIKTTRRYESERLNKNVYVALVYALLAAQPLLWLLVQGV